MYHNPATIRTGWPTKVLSALSCGAPQVSLLVAAPSTLIVSKQLRHRPHNPFSRSPEPHGLSHSHTLAPTDAKHQTPRFPEPRSPTDAGPGDYISSDFDCRGPAYSLRRRTPKSPAAPDSPGPGQYIRVRLSTEQGGNEATEGFGKRDSPRFVTGKILVAIHRSPHGDSQAVAVKVLNTLSYVVNKTMPDGSGYVVEKPIQGSLTVLQLQEKIMQL